MYASATRFFLVLTLLAYGACAVAGEDSLPSETRSVQTVKVNGTDLTGLNASALTNLLSQAKQQGVIAVVVDMSAVSHMTPAGMASLAAGRQNFGSDNFAVANLSGQPADLAQSKGADRFQTFPSVEEAVTALNK